MVKKEEEEEKQKQIKSKRVKRRVSQGYHRGDKSEVNNSEAEDEKKRRIRTRRRSSDKTEW